MKSGTGVESLISVTKKERGRDASEHDEISSQGPISKVYKGIPK